MDHIAERAVADPEVSRQIIREQAAEIARLQRVLRDLDDRIFNDPQVIERAGEWRTMIAAALSGRDEQLTKETKV